jgi:hypothetical protein
VTAKRGFLLTEWRLAQQVQKSLLYNRSSVIATFVKVGELT